MGMALVLFLRWLSFSGAISVCAADGAFGRQNRGLIAVALALLAGPPWSSSRCPSLLPLAAMA